MPPTKLSPVVPKVPSLSYDGSWSPSSSKFPTQVSGEPDSDISDLCHNVEVRKRSCSPSSSCFHLSLNLNVGIQETTHSSQSWSDRFYLRDETVLRTETICDVNRTERDKRALRLVESSLVNQEQPVHHTTSRSPVAFALSEPQVAGSLPPWAARVSSLDLQQASCPEQADLMKRCASYSLWPETRGMHSRNMALAGFYYTGIGQQICCFYCGLSVEQVSASEDIWDTHAQGSPSCQYLVKMKGQHEQTRR